MSARALVMAAAGSTGADKLYVDDVFSAYTYTGNGSTQTITNGIDLAGKGGLVWIKSRSNGSYQNTLTDTVKGTASRLFSDSTAAENTSPDVSAFTASGFSVSSQGYVNASSATYVSWTFRKAPKFFDVVTYTGDGSGARSIAHSLGVAPGMVIHKRTDSTSNWFIYHRSLGNNTNLTFTTDAASTPSGGWNTTDPTASTVTFGSAANVSGASYVAYLFAHDTTADGIVQCGSFTTDGSGNATVNHGWSAGVQFAQIKASSTTGDWEMFDTTRTPSWSSSDARLRANLSNAEDSVSRISASGTSLSFAGLSASQTYVYVFIVAPT